MAQTNESTWDILEEKSDTLRQETLKRAKNDPELARELYATGLFPEFEGFYYPYKPSAGSLAKESQS